MFSKSHYDHLRSKWIDQRTLLQANLKEKHPELFDHIKRSVKHAVVGTVGGLMLLMAPTPSSPTMQKTDAQVQQFVQKVDNRVFLMNDLYHELPDSVSALSPFQESVIVQTLSRHFHLDVAAQLQGIRLNRTYGYIGQEQHLARYPGDGMDTHFDGNASESAKYASTGMAPGLGAWGYFAPSQSAMTQKDVDREKYYIAVQTFLSPGYNEHVAEYNKFYKYHKMLVVNPQNGKAMVVVIGDAGPGSGTGKQLGGSPEVMKYLERVDGAQKGPVLYFFIDDPGDTIPLGPVDPVE